MLTLLGSLLGFISSAFPELLKLWQDRADRKHELAILNRQMEQMRLGHNQRLEEIAINADISESQALYQHDGRHSGIAWIEGLRASVRPVITYAFFLVFTTVKITVLYSLVVDQNLPFLMPCPLSGMPTHRPCLRPVCPFGLAAGRWQKPVGNNPRDDLIIP